MVANRLSPRQITWKLRGGRMFIAAEFFQPVDAIYGGILEASDWEAALVAVCRAFGGDQATLALHDARARDARVASFVDADEPYQASDSGLTSLPDMAGAYRAILEALPRAP